MEPSYHNRPYGNKCSKNLGHHICLFVIKYLHPSVPNNMSQFRAELRLHEQRKPCAKVDRTFPDRCTCPRCNVFAMLDSPNVDLRQFSPELYRRDYKAYVADVLIKGQGDICEVIRSALCELRNQRCVSTRCSKHRKCKWCADMGNALGKVFGWNGKTFSVYPMPDKMRVIADHFRDNTLVLDVRTLMLQLGVPEEETSNMLGDVPLPKNTTTKAPKAEEASAVAAATAADAADGNPPLPVPVPTNGAATTAPKPAAVGGAAAASPSKKAATAAATTAAAAAAASADPNAPHVRASAMMALLLEVTNARAAEIEGEKDDAKA
jgi:hypothetical protein